ncbi:MAG: DUF1801 domain-containing protein [Henriciella sp.]|nr:DUF1801 domain-containing protein [Henriciella sp.]
MAKPTTVAAYFAGLAGAPFMIAQALRETIDERWPQLNVKLAWGFPSWGGNERVFSIIAHKDRCNLQLWSGARLAGDYLGRIEGTGKAMRHVKVYSVDEIDDELIDIIERAVSLDRTDPQKVR